MQKKVNIGLVVGVVISCYILLTSATSLAVSLVYRGFLCEGGYSTPGNTPAESRFEVLSDEGGGVYRLRLTQGIPHFENGSGTVCIGSGETSIGYDTSVGIKPTRLSSREAIGVFDGEHLTITINSILYLDTSNIYPDSHMLFSGLINPYTHILVFDFNGIKFNLTNLISNMGSVSVSGIADASALAYISNRLRPSLSLTIIIPPASIGYEIEQ